MRNYLNQLQTGALLSIGFSFLMGCATHPDVLDLTNKTGAAVAIINTNLKKFKQLRSEIAEERAKRMARLNQVVKELNYYKTELEAMKLSGETQEIQFFEKLRKYHKDLLAIHSSARETEETTRSDILATQTELSSSEGLAAISKKLADLGKETDFKDRLRFFISYAQDINSEIEKKRKKQKEENEKTVKEIQETQTEVP